MKKELHSLTTESRSECLENLGIESRQESPESLLLGRCRSNTDVLKQNLVSEGYNVRTRCGVLRTATWKESTDISSTQEAIENKEPIHFWVEVDDYICEVASESERYFGEPIVTQQSPEQLGYQVFEDSYDIPL